MTQLIHLPLNSDLVDIEATLATGQIKRKSAATKIDDSVLSTVDGDGTPFSNASIHDETYGTGYTDIKGAFAGTKQWFDGEVLGADHLGGAGDCSTDFAAGYAGFTYDAVNDEYDIDNSGGGTPYIIPASDFTIGNMYKVTFEIKNYVDGSVAVSGSSGSGETTLRTANGTYNQYVTVSINTSIYLISTNVSTLSVDNIIVKLVTSLSTQYASTGNLLKIEDAAGKKGYGFIGHKGTGLATTPLTNNVTAISKANPGVVSSVAHGLVVGDLAYFDSLNEMVELNTKYKVVTAVGSVDLFSINDTSGYANAEVTGGACVHEVTEPNASAVHIYKEHGLLNEGWNALNSGLDYNADTSWLFNVHVNLMSSAGGTAQPRFEDSRLLIEPEATNHCLYSRDLSNAAWVKTDCTGTKGQIGLDLVANSASLLTATGANATAFQTMKMASSAKSFYVYIKRSVGSGSVYITDDGGAHYTECTGLSSSVFTKYRITRTQADPVVGFKIATSGDAVIVDCNQLEQTPFSTSFIPALSIPVTRTTEAGDAADNGYSWTIPQALKNILDDAEPVGSPTDSEGTLLFDIMWGCDESDIVAADNGLVAINDAAQGIAYFDADSFDTHDDTADSEVAHPAFSLNDIIHYVARWGDVDGNVNDISAGRCEAGGAYVFDATPANYDGEYGMGTDLRLCFGTLYPIHISDVRFLTTPLTQDQLAGRQVRGKIITTGIF